MRYRCGLLATGGEKYAAAAEKSCWSHEAMREPWSSAAFAMRDGRWHRREQVIRFSGFEASQYRTPSMPVSGPGGRSSHRLGGGAACPVFPFAVGLVEQLFAQADR